MENYIIIFLFGVFVGGHGFLRRPFGRHVIRPDFKGRRRSGAAGKAPGHEEIGGAAWGKGA